MNIPKETIKEIEERALKKYPITDSNIDYNLPKREAYIQGSIDMLNNL